MPCKTLLYHQHLKLGARIIDFHGWLLPVQYQSILAEHRHCRTVACLFDTSHMGRFLITGKSAATELAFLLTHDSGCLPAGRCRYGFLLNTQAGIIDDTILMRLAEDQFLLVVNAATAGSDLQWIKSHLSAQTSLVDQTATHGKLDLQGPASFKVLARLVDTHLASLKYFSVTRTNCCGQDCIVSRTGYTGELGYEIFAPNRAAIEIFQTILANPAVRPAGLGARDSLRLEMSYPLYGQDIDSNCNPLEADLAQFITTEHEFIGSAKLKEFSAQGSARKLVAFQAQSRRRTNPADQISLDDHPIGTVTSGAFSPSLNTSIGLGYVPTALAQAGTELAVNTARAQIPITVSAKPLYRKGTCRVNLTAREKQQ